MTLEVKTGPGRKPCLPIDRLTGPTWHYTTQKMGRAGKGSLGPWHGTARHNLVFNRAMPVLCRARVAGLRHDTAQPAYKLFNFFYINKILNLK